MKYFSIFALSLSILGCVAQRSFITLPASGTDIEPNQELLVQVTRPNSIQGSTEVGMVIGLLQCQQDPCPSPNSEIGYVLFNGQYNPQIHEKPGEPYQNFTVTVPGFQPTDGSTNRAQLATARFHLIGAGPSPTLELNTVPLNIVFE